VNKVLLPLVLIISMSVMMGMQSAYATPDCATAGIREGLKSNELYVGDQNGRLWKVDTNDADACSLGLMKPFPSATAGIKCTDVALDATPIGGPLTDRLYCITFSDLYEIDRDTAAATFIGNLMDGIVNVVDMNALEIDFGGLAYTAAISGNFYTLDLTDGSLDFKKDLGHPSAGDLAWYAQTGKMYWTSTDCPACIPVRNGLFVIDLVTFTATFIDTTTFLNVFAMDFIPVDNNLHFVTQSGKLVEMEKDGDQVGLTLTTAPLVRAFGGTANQILVGGMKVAIDTTALMLAGIYTSPVWLAPGVLGVIALVAFKIQKKN
jgi:hypothetical protein